MMDAALLLLFLALGILPIWGIIDAAKRSDLAWQEVGGSRVAWIVAMLLLGFIAAALYFISVRPRFSEDDALASPAPDRWSGWGKS
jgi:hypothetical protein